MFLCPPLFFPNSYCCLILTLVTLATFFTEIRIRNTQTSDLYQKDLSTGRWILRLEKKATTIGTLIGYVSYVRNWVRYCLENDRNPIHFPTDPILVKFWISALAKKQDSINSIRSWTSSLTWLTTCYGHSSANWKKDPDLLLYRKKLDKEYGTGRDDRFPFRLQHLLRYTIKKRVIPGYYYSVSFDTLLEVLLAQLFFITMSRPCELINSPSSKDYHGLLCKHATYHKHRVPRKHFLFLVGHYKNQAFKKDPKQIYLTSTRTGCTKKPCICQIINPFNLLYIYKERRQRMYEKEYFPDLKRKLALSPNNKLFVRQNGLEATTIWAKTIVDDLIRFNRVMEPDRYKQYSLRIGGSTLASQMGIPHEIIQALVKWMRNNLPTASVGYIRPTPEDAMVIPGMMLHGYITKAGFRAPTRGGLGYVYNPFLSTRRLRN